MIVKNSKNAHSIILIFSLLLLTLSLILLCNSNANLPVKIGDINNNGLVDLQDVTLAFHLLAGVAPAAPIYHEGDVNDIVLLRLGGRFDWNTHLAKIVKGGKG